jgi:uncharacterized protein (DUF433 family)
MTLDTKQTVPLTLWEDGTIRVKGTRLLLDMIVNAHNRGEIPEDIAEAFPAASVADVYTIIAYYLHNKRKIDEYLELREKEAVKISKLIESDPKHQARIRELNKILASDK